MTYRLEINLNLPKIRVSDLLRHTSNLQHWQNSINGIHLSKDYFNNARELLPRQFHGSNKKEIKFSGATKSPNALSCPELFNNHTSKLTKDLLVFNELAA